MTAHSNQKTRFQIILGSIWSWDFQLATAAALTVGIIVVEIDFAVNETWLYPAFAVSGVAVAASFRSWRSQKDKLTNTDYGELVRIADPSEIEARMPYTITTWISMFSMGVSLFTFGFLEDVDRRWAEATLLSATTLLFVWSIFALCSLIHLSNKHDENIAKVLAIKEDTEALALHSRLEDSG